MSDDLDELTKAEQRGYANAMEAERKLHEDRIEQLERELVVAIEVVAESGRKRGEAEAKLAKAVEVLRFYAPQTAGGITFLGGDDAGKRAAAVLAELEGKDE